MITEPTETFDPTQGIDPIVLEGQERLAQSEDDFVGGFSPVGDFKKKSLNSLVKVTRKLQPLFGLKADYPLFETDETRLPVEFTRMLMMTKQAIDDAVAADVVDETNLFELEDVVDDTSLQLLSGKLNNVVKNKSFKKFMDSPVVDDREVPFEEAPVQEPTDAPAVVNPTDVLPEQSIDELYQGRI